MPYIITMTTPDPVNARETARVGDPVPNAPTLMGAVRGCWPPKVTRIAVATLDEARDAVANSALASMPFVDICAAVTPRDGGTVGPLPDGTVIQVQPVEWNTLANLADAPKYPRVITYADILAAFNAR